MQHEDFLVEIHCEELPPKSLLRLGEIFALQIEERLQKADLRFAGIQFFATPRRLAVLIKNLAAKQPDQDVERKGPALNMAFDAAGKPSPACVGFARSCGVEPAQLTTIKTEQGEWVGYKQKVAGKSVQELMPAIIEQAIAALPIPRRMRWGSGDTQFARPVHSVMMLYGAEIVPATILGCQAGNKTRGHRFHAPDWITIKTPADYELTMEKEGYVLADFSKRREWIREQTKAVNTAQVLMSPELLDEVTGLVEWPVALSAQFEEEFLQLPKEVLISSMQDHQRYFPVEDAKGKLLPSFVTISNIQSEDPKRVIQGNKRVLRARLSDAAFFYATDKKESLEKRVERLKGIVFQAKLGTLYDKAERISALASLIAKKMQADEVKAQRAGLLAKTDLTTSMVGEFPELQGVMGYYYATHDGEAKEVALALKEQYLPRFSGDVLAAHPVGQAVALADRIDTLVGAFGINQIPTGDKDPYGLRRAALGVIRTLIENEINLDLKEIITAAVQNYGSLLLSQEVIPQLLNFIQERLRAWYLDQDIAADVFASVAALSLSNPLDMHERVKAVQAFKKLSEAETLSIANKRVSNILAKYDSAIDAKAVNPEFFDNSAEQELARQLDAKSKLVRDLSESGKYSEVLLQLAELRQPVDDFFDQVMVMTEDKPKRENRILLLSQLRALFLQVADIALLQ